MKILFMFMIGLLGCSHYRTENYDQFAQAAQHLFEKNEFVETLTMLDQIEAQDLLSSELVLIQCHSLEKLERSAQAYDCYKKGQKLYPHKSVFELKILSHLIEQDQTEDAHNFIQELESRLSSEQEFVRLKANLASKNSQWEEASKLYAKSLEIRRNDQDLLAMGKSLFLNGKTQQSRQALEEIQNEELKTEAARYLAWIYVDAKEQRLANAQIRLLLKHHPQDTLAKKLFLRNLTLSEHADRVTLVKEYNKLFDDEWGQYHYWQALKEIDQRQEANDYLARLWNQNKSEAWVASHYANELLEQNNIAAAETILKETIMLANHSNKESLNFQLAEIGRKKEIMRNLASLRSHKVEKGDTLEGISLKFYGSRNRWSDIQKHNLMQINNPKRLKVGVDLSIPQLQP